MQMTEALVRGQGGEASWSWNTSSFKTFNGMALQVQFTFENNR